MSGNGNDGTLQGATVSYSNIGGTMNCTGTNYISTSSVVEAATNSNLQTFCGWLIGDGALFGSNASGTGQFHFRVSLASGTLTFRVTYYGGMGGEIDDTASVTSLSSNYIVVVKTSSKKYDVYFNASKVMNQVNKEATVSTLFFPGYYYSGSYNNGTVSNHMIYNRALSDSEILQNFNNGRQRFGI
jgi:hypothetical protein